MKKPIRFFLATFLCLCGFSYAFAGWAAFDKKAPELPAPTDLSVKVDDRWVTFTWTAQPDYIYVFTCPEAGVVHDNIPGPTVQDGTITYDRHFRLEEDGDYTWSVYAKDDQGNRSDTVFGPDFTVGGATPSTVPAPENLAVASTDSTVTFAWDGRPGYMYYLSVYDDRNSSVFYEFYPEGYQPLTQTQRVELKYTLGELTNMTVGNTYKWSVSALNESFLESDEVFGPSFVLGEASVDTVPTPDPQPDTVAAPSNLQVCVEGDSVFFSWEVRAGLAYGGYIRKDGQPVGMVSTPQAMPVDYDGTFTQRVEWTLGEGTFTWSLQAMDYEKQIESAEVQGPEFTYIKPVPDTVPDTVPTALGKDLLSGISLYPNPCNGSFQINLPVKADVDIYNPAGVKVEQRRALTGIQTFTLTVPGLYVVRIGTPHAVAVKRVMVR